MPEAEEMRVAELARRSELSVPTIKYYLRDGLLQPGRWTSANQAVYDTAHLERLRLIRALATVAGLPLAEVRVVIDAVDTVVPGSSILDVMAVVQDTLVQDSGDGEILEEAVALLDRGVVLGNALRRPMLDAPVLLAQQHYAKSVEPES